MRTESPLKGWPKTKPLHDKEGNELGFRVRAKYLTPGRAKFSETLIHLISACALIAYIWAMVAERLGGWQENLTVGAAWVVMGSLLFASRFALGRFFFGKVTKLEFLPDTIRIKNGFRFRNYKRTLPHAFDIAIHDRAEDEENAEREAAIKNKDNESERRKFYRRGFHVIFRYAGQRVDVASVYGRKEAEALLVRLQLLDQLMDAASGDVSSPVFAEPDKQYGARPEAG